MGRLRPGQGGSCAPDAWVGPGGARQGAAFCAERSSRVDQLLDHLAFRTERRGRGASQPQRAAAPVRSTPYEDWQNTRATARQPPGLSTHPKTGRLKIFRSIYSASRPGEKRSSSHHSKVSWPVERLTRKSDAQGKRLSVREDLGGR